MAEQAKQDRRSRRSRRLIGDALLMLMREKRYDRITVQEIIDCADVGRTTFYAQFRNKDDVLIGEIEQALGLLHEQHRSTAANTSEQFLPGAGFFRHVQEAHALYPTLVHGPAFDPHYQAIQHYLRELAAEQLARAAGARKTAVPNEVIADFLAGSLITLARWWLDHGSEYTPEQMEAYYRQLTLPGVQAVLGTDSE